MANLWNEIRLGLAGICLELAIMLTPRDCTQQRRLAVALMPYLRQTLAGMVDKKPNGAEHAHGG